MTPSEAKGEALEQPALYDSATTSEYPLQLSFEFAPDAQLITDGHGVVQRANHAAAVLLRCPKPFLIGKPLGLFVIEGQRGRFYDSLSRLWQGVTIDEFETKVTRKNVPPRDVLIRVASTGLRTETRSAAAFQWILKDMTQLKRSE